MKHIIKGALMALALAAAPVIAAVPAVAATDFSITLGNAAFGFSDGYWDRDHHGTIGKTRTKHNIIKPIMPTIMLLPGTITTARITTKAGNNRYWDKH